MDAGSEFYIVLPSNVITDEFPHNTTSKYSTPLPNPLTLRAGKWEVGLAEVHYPHSWYNISDGENVFRFEYLRTGDEVLGPFPKDTHVPNDASKLKTTLAYIKPGYYKPHEIAVEINRQLALTKFKGRITYGTHTGFMTMDLYPQERFHLNRMLAHLLGFKKTKMANKASKSGPIVTPYTTIKAKRVVNLEATKQWILFK